jgi:SHS2 domain-containing protein
MSSAYKFIDHTADVAVDIEADSMEELFMVSAQAWKETIFENNIIEIKEEKKIKIAENDLELLLVKFLDELNFLFQTKKWICSFVKEISFQKNNAWSLSALLSGENFNEDKHPVSLEIKAVTFHQMEIRNKDGKFLTRIVFDI